MALSELLEITWRSLYVAGLATLIAAVPGLPLGVWLGSRGKKSRFTQAFLYAGMGLPPVVVGLVVYLLLSRSGPLGGLGLLYTPSAMIFAEVVLAFPLIASLTLAGVAAKAEAVRLLVKSLGGSEHQALWTLLAESRKVVIAALAAGFGGAISEVGAATLAGGDIRHQTRVLTTAVVLETRKGELEAALALGAILLGLALLASAILVVFSERD